jgi:hypothetical protein
MSTAGWLTLPVLLLAAACETIVTDEAPPLAPGTYALASIGGVPLPAQEPCSAFRIEEERITIGPLGDVEYHQRTTRPPASEVRTVSATGSYRATFDGRVELLLKFTGSGAPDAFNTVLDRTPDGLTQIAGQPCDVYSVKLYRLQR